MRLLRSWFAPLLTLTLVAGVVDAKPFIDGQEACSFVAEVTVLGAEHGAFAACLITRQPVACAIAAAAESVATQELVKEGITQACTWTVKRVGEKIRISVEAPADQAEEVHQTYKILRKANGLRVLKKPSP